MIILKQVIHAKKTNSVEATWVDVITPAIEVPESVEPDTADKDGNIIPGKVTPAHTIDAVEKQVKCHSYADVQMPMFRDDVAEFGGLIADYEPMIAEVEAAIIPYVPPPATVPYRVDMKQARLALLDAGLLPAVIDAINGLTGTAGDAARIEWEFSAYVHRDQYLVTQIAGQLGLTDAQLDDLFVAATLK